MSDKNEYSIEVQCPHKFFSSSKVDSVSFCSKCGIMKFGNCKTYRSRHFNHACDTDPLEGLSKKIIEDTKIVFDYDNDSHKDYCVKREYILQFLKSLIDKHNFRESIYFLAIVLLDYIMLSTPNYNCEMAVYSCFLLASKHNSLKSSFLLGKFYEYDPKLPSMKQISQALSGNFSDLDIKRSEMICLKLLGYKLDRTTSFDFLEYFLKNGIIFENEIKNGIQLNFLEDEIYDFTLKTLNFFLTDSRYFDFTPLQISCAIITFSREQFNLKGWDEKISTIYNIKLEDFMNCYFVLKTIYSKESEQIFPPEKVNEFFYNDNSELNNSFTTQEGENQYRTKRNHSSAEYYPRKDEMMMNCIYDNEEVKTPTVLPRHFAQEYYYPFNYMSVSRVSNVNELNSTLDISSYSLSGSRKPISISSYNQPKYTNLNISNSFYQFSQNYNAKINSNYYSNGHMPLNISPFNIGSTNNFSNYSNNISFPHNIDNFNNVYNYLFQ